MDVNQVINHVNSLCLIFYIILLFNSMINPRNIFLKKSHRQNEGALLYARKVNPKHHLIVIK